MSTMCGTINNQRITYVAAVVVCGGSRSAFNAKDYIRRPSLSVCARMLLPYVTYSGRLFSVTCALPALSHFYTSMPC